MREIQEGTVQKQMRRLNKGWSKQGPAGKFLMVPVDPSVCCSSSVLCGEAGPRHGGHTNRRERMPRVWFQFYQTICKA